MTEKQLLRFIENRLDADEKEQVISWIETNSENQRKYNLLKAKHVSRGLQNIRTGSTQESNSLQKKQKQQKIHTSLSIAASITLIVGAALFYVLSGNKQVDFPETVTETATLPQNMEEVMTEKKLLREITLPDGSLVSLNADSKIIYPKVFDDGIREVILKGEAFFDIVHDESRPFIVKTDEFNIKVLGTTFNVKSYPEDKLAEATLLSGKVELSLEQETPIILAPSQKAIFNKEDKKIEIEKVEPENSLGWKSGKLIFNNTPLKQVVIDLERKYGKKITIASSELLDYKYTGSFDDLTVDEVLKLLVISSPIKYQNTNQKIILSMK